VGEQGINGGDMLMDQILTGDCRDLIKAVPDGSVDLIFTDPPYPKEYLYLYEWLANEAPRVLKPDGFLAVYVGIYHLANVIRFFDGKMDFFIECIIFGKDNGSIIWPRKTIAKHKSLFVFRPLGAKSMPRCNMTSVFNGTREDKRFHAWGQDEASARYYIDCLSSPSQLVLDPFCGGGTTPAMCKVIDRHYLSFEVDWVYAENSRIRVADQQVPVIDLSYQQNEIEAQK